MIHLKETLKCAALAACAATLVCFAVTALSVKHTVEAVPKILTDTRTEALAAISDTRADLIAQITITRAETLARVDRLQAELRRQADALRTTMDARAGSIERSTMDEIRATRSDLVQQIAPPLQSVTALVDQSRAMEAELGRRLGPWTSCAGNGACWQAQATAALGATRVTLGQTSRTMRAVAEAAPGTTQAVQGITVAADKIATKFASERPWWRKALSAIPYAGWLVSTVGH